MWGLRQREQVGTEAVGTGDALLDRAVGFAPDGEGVFEETMAGFGESTSRFRLSFLSATILTSLRRSSGLRLAVSVVRSIASTFATAPMLGSVGRFSDVSSEN